MSCGRNLPRRVFNKRKSPSNGIKNISSHHLSPPSHHILIFYFKSLHPVSNISNRHHLSTQLQYTINTMVDQGSAVDAQCPSYAVALGYMGVASAVCLSNWGSAVSRKRLSIRVAVIFPRSITRSRRRRGENVSETMSIYNKTKGGMEENNRSNHVLHN